MDWLLVATAIGLVTAVGAVDIQETKTFMAMYTPLFLTLMSNSPIGIDLLVVISLGPSTPSLMLNA